MNATGIKFILVAGLLILGFCLEIALGSVQVSLAEMKAVFLGNTLSSDRSFVKDIIIESRIPRAFTAVLAGSGLALCGLLMQSMFRNPLAGPSVLGISSGASLGVSLVFAGGLGFGISQQWLIDVSVSAAAMLGSLVVLAGVMMVSLRLRDHVSLLIFGLMTGYLCSALVTLVEFGASKEAIRSIVFWGMGSFASVSYFELKLMALVIIPGCVAALLMSKKLNIMLLGKDYARSLGLNYNRTTFHILLITGALTGVITAYCGPIAFLGLAVPLVARIIFKKSDHLILLPATLLCGAVLALFCDLISRLPGSDLSIPLNAITSLIGAPVVIALIFRNSRMKSWF
jgi:iron complex transport system permease protein